MRVKAVRGVCVGVGRNLKAGDTADLDPGTVSFLVSINAVEVLPEPEPPRKKAPKTEPKEPQAKPAEPSPEKPESGTKEN